MDRLYPGPETAADDDRLRRDGDAELELEVLTRLGAVESLAASLSMGLWRVDDEVLAHLELLIRQARRRLAVAHRPEGRAA